MNKAIFAVIVVFTTIGIFAYLLYFEFSFFIRKKFKPNLFESLIIGLIIVAAIHYSSSPATGESGIFVNAIIMPLIYTCIMVSGILVALFYIKRNRSLFKRE